MLSPFFHCATTDDSTKGKAQRDNSVVKAHRVVSINSNKPNFRQGVEYELDVLSGMYNHILMNRVRNFRNIFEVSAVSADVLQDFTSGAASFFDVFLWVKHILTRGTKSNWHYESVFVVDINSSYELRPRYILRDLCC